MTTNNSNPPRKRRRAIFRFFIGIACTALIYCIGAIHFSLTKSGLDRDYLKEINAKHAALSDDDRAWRVYESARNAWQEIADPLETRISAYYAEQRQLEVEDPLYDSPPDPYTSNENPFQVPRDHPFYPDVLVALDAFQPHLTAIREAARLPACAFPALDNWTSHPDDDFRLVPLPPAEDLRERVRLFDLFMPQIGMVRQASKILAFDSAVATENQDRERIVANFEAIVNIARQTHGEPMLMSHLIALGNLDIAARTLETAMQSPTVFLTDGDLDRLVQIAWQASQTLTYVDFREQSLAHQEMVDLSYTKDSRGNGRIAYDGLRIMYEGDDRDPPHPVVLAFYWPVQHRMADRRSQQALMDDAFAALADLRAAGPQGLPAFNTSLAAIEQRETAGKRYPWRPAWLLSTYATTTLAPHLTRTRLQAAATRIALERHKLATGHYPGSLTQLIPTYLPELPEDPFNPGHPINYLLRNNQPILYSVGSNGVDNHATPAPQGTNPANLEARFANPAGPSPDAPTADWILSPQD